MTPVLADRARIAYSLGAAGTPAFSGAELPVSTVNGAAPFRQYFCHYNCLDTAVDRRCLDWTHNFITPEAE
ncbi:hypothetical protein G6M17_24365 [Agrobacterium tumefaciens]|uniref:hypothetical protein n=1 Tax=Rhizobium/Agrobacterium group TaxID=227290 RepID=UPI001571A354|nr:MULTISPECIES: hypothetical protein [Rhizobium/Agrobacterium group]MCZ7441270.1 hypothetical protein [Rhizobium rhizogenes]NSZ82320.1 hypothetical protein [Agrobacterium tumefaciens]